MEMEKTQKQTEKGPRTISMADKVPFCEERLIVKTKLNGGLLTGGAAWRRGASGSWEVLVAVQAVTEWSHWWRTWVELAGCEV